MEINARGVFSSPGGMGPPGWTVGPRGHPQLGDAVGERVTITSVSQPPPPMWLWDGGSFYF